MNPIITPTRSRLFFLHAPDEVRHPYEVALGRLNSEIRWFSSYDQLVSQAVQRPRIVIVDLDAIQKPWEAPVEQLRAIFPKSHLIALSSQDSAQIALRCLRSGFSDFLLKPLSPEELAWSVRKVQQHLDVVDRIRDPRTHLVRTITQVSSSTNPTLVRLSVLEHLKHLFHAKKIAWVGYGDDKVKVLGVMPRTASEKMVLRALPKENQIKKTKRFLLLKAKKSGLWKIYIPCHHHPQGILVWGMGKAPTRSKREEALTLIDHAEISLLNLEKFEEVKQQTFVDDLTGLYNSRYLKYAIGNAILRCKSPNQGFSVLFIDVDHFKKVNDQNSHLVGSEFLVAIGKTIRNTVRNIDPVFRYGGDEFVVILHDTHAEGAAEIAERIRKHIERRVFVIKGKKLQTTVSIGLAAYPEHAADQEALLRLADEAMYDAKKSTRNAVHLAVGLAPLRKVQGL